MRRNDDPLLRAVERALGCPIPERLWQWLNAYLKLKADIEQGRITPEGGAEIVQQLLSALSDPEKPQFVRTRAGRGDELQNRVISLLLAHEAEKDPRVSLWRERALGGRLLAPQALAGWIRTVAAEQPPEPNTLPVRFIQFPENGWVVSLPVRAGGILDQLERLAQSLARIFDWHPAEAVAFIATGQVPQFRLYRVRFTRQFVIPRLSRITLELCPTLSPRQVARLYDAMRKSVLSGRPKRLSERQLKLVLFRLTHHQLSHRDALRRWNRAYRRWAYRRLDNFKRDVRVAIERLASLPFA